MAIHASKEFPGLGFDYDPQKDLYFKVIAKENLRKLKQLATGKALLKALRDARPGANNFPKGVNVVLQPPLSRQYSAPGLAGGNANIKIGDQGKYDDWYYGRKGMLMPSINAKIACQGVDESEGVGKMTGNGRVGTGCACWVYYNNNELRTKDGTWLVPHVTLGHELIHAWHYLNGAAERNDRSEEHMTVGIKGFQNMPFTENKLRAEANIPQRTKYFADD